jgi:hypothetical protein
MAIPLQKRLDEEIRERIKSLEEKFNNRKDIEVSEIFASPRIPELLEKPSIFLPGSGEARLRMTIPFYETVLLEICGRCECVRNPDPMLPFLRTEGVVPVLLVGPYSEFDERFVKEIIKLPHIPYGEFMFHRSIAILAQSKMRVCEHCVREKRKDILKRLAPSEESEHLVDQFFWLLSPFVDPDYELIAEFAAALDAQDAHQLTQIMQLA